MKFIFQATKPTSISKQQQQPKEMSKANAKRRLMEDHLGKE